MKTRKPEDPVIKLTVPAKFLLQEFAQKLLVHSPDGLVKAHTKYLYVDGFQVQKGRERVIKEKQKNVCRNWGTLLMFLWNVGLKPIGYNPYKHKTFIQGLSKAYISFSGSCTSTKAVWGNFVDFPEFFVRLY